MTNKVRTSAQRASPGSEQITDQARIARLLEQLARRYTPLTVQIPGHEALYTSCTVGVEKPYVLLDELMPSTGHEVLLRERTLNVLGKLDGVDIRFIASLERVDEQDNVLTYYMNLPRHLEYMQRRSDYRVHIPMSMRLRVIIDDEAFTDDDGITIEGDLHDLSKGGAGMIFPVTDSKVESGKIYECAFELPDEGWLYCSVELRYAKEISSHNRQLIGARFIDLYPPQKRLIGRCISELEREFIRKRAAYQ